MKIKAIFIIIIISLLGYSVANAQTGFCITEPGPTDYLEGIPAGQQANPGPYNIRIFTHIIRRSNGTGGMTADELATALARITADLSNHSVCITHAGNKDILNDTYYNSSWSANFNNIIATNPHSNAIDLYFAPVTNPSAGGRASGIPGSALVLGGDWSGLPVYTSHILSHELGHCLGLYHTHHGTIFEGGDDTGQCKELVNGTNCGTCGDYVCDTPADPYLGFNVNTSTCQWMGSGTDANGQAYNPDEENIMSYTQPTCMDYFSALQGQRFRDMIATHPILHAVKESSPCGECAENLFINFPVFGNETYQASNKITGTSIIDPAADAAFKAGQQIQLLPGFYAAEGCDFYAYIEDCSSGLMTRAVAENTAPETPHSIRTTDPKTPTTENNRQATDMGNLALSCSPNPFHHTATISYTLPQDSPVTLTVIDLTGRIVYQLVNEKQPKGAYEVSFDAQKLAPGMYLGQLKEGEAVKTIKLVLQ